jgi:hypothetical protein
VRLKVEVYSEDPENVREWREVPGPPTEAFRRTFEGHGLRKKDSRRIFGG